MFDWLDTATDYFSSTPKQARRAIEPEADADVSRSGFGQAIADASAGLEQEGLAGILDPIGMLDRQRAQHELASRFEIVDDEGTAERSNQVSPEEFEDIAKTYSDIRLGRGDLTMDSSKYGDDSKGRVAWEAGIQDDLADILMTESGRAQVMALADNPTEDGVHHQTTITPYTTDSAAPNHQAAATPDDLAAAYRTADGPRGEGTNVNLRINPGEIKGLRSDVAMVHEMNHALHETQGTLARGQYQISNPQDEDYMTFNYERQTTGLTRSDTYPGFEDPESCTENEYRYERNLLGDNFRPRTEYKAGVLAYTTPSNMSAGNLAREWDDYLGIGSWL